MKIKNFIKTLVICLSIVMSIQNHNLINYLYQKLKKQN